MVTLPKNCWPRLLGLVVNELYAGLSVIVCPDGNFIAYFATLCQEKLSRQLSDIYIWALHF